MVARISIILISAMLKRQRILVYNGPNPNMPDLLPYRRLPLQTCYTSSTFQVFILVLCQRNSSLKLIYSPQMNKDPSKLFPNTNLNLINNTGCGNGNDKSWMCVVKIVAPRNTNVRLRLTDFIITGPYAGTIEVAGIAIYNIINNQKILIAHLHEGRKKYVTVTGSGDQLLVSVYGYAPFAMLFVILAAEISYCVGLFVSEYKQPCDEMKLGHYNNTPDIRSACIGRFYKLFNVTYRCLALQTTISPFAYFDHTSLRILFHFEYISQVRVTYSSTMSNQWCAHMRLFGKYHYIDGNDYEAYDAMGEIHHMYFVPNSNCGFQDFTVITVSETPCIHPCSDVNIALVYSHERAPTCDLYKYFWLDS